MKYSSLFIFTVIIGIAIILMTSMKIFTQGHKKGSWAGVTKGMKKKESMTDDIFENMTTNKKYKSYKEMYDDTYDDIYGVMEDEEDEEEEEEEEDYVSPSPSNTNIVEITPSKYKASTCDVFSSTNAELSNYFQNSFVGMMEPIIKRVMDDITNSVSSAKSCNSKISSAGYPYAVSCPDCDISNGVCINCGGNGGSGTRNSVGGVTNNLIDTTGNIASDVVKGVAGLGETVVNDATLLGVGGEMLGSQVVDTVGNLALNAGQGVYNLANNSATGVGGENQSGGQGAGGIPFGSLLSSNSAETMNQNASGVPSQGEEASQGEEKASSSSSQIMTPPVTSGGGVPGIDNYSAFGALVPKGSNFVPLVASFNAFAK